MAEPRTAAATTGKALVNRVVKKLFPGCGIFCGKVIRFVDNLYEILYMDGEDSVVTHAELEQILMPPGEVFETLKKTLEAANEENQKKAAKRQKNGGKASAFDV